MIIIADPTQVQDAAGHESSHRDHAEDGAGGVLLAQDQDDELGGGHQRTEADEGPSEGASVGEPGHGARFISRTLRQMNQPPSRTAMTPPIHIFR